MTLNYTTLTGTFEDGSGSPLSGNVTFMPSQSVYASGIPLVTPDTPVVAEIAGGLLKNASGAPLTLLATDNAGLSLASGTGFWYWTVSLQFGQVTDGWSFFLPSSPNTADLYSLKNTPAAGPAVSSVFGRTGAVVATTGDYTPSQVGAVAKSGDTMTGDLSPAVAVLTDGTTIAVNAALGNDFRVTLGGNRTMDAPSNPHDGQKIVFEIIQDGTGSRTLAWTSGAGGYDFGTTGAPVLSTAAGMIDQVGFRYSAAKGEWLCTGSALGF